MHLNRALAAGLLALAAGGASARIQITEWMYNGADATGEYVEFSNLGGTAVDFGGWSFDDSSRTPGSQSLSALGSVAPGASVILTEATAEAFRAAWSLAAGVAVVGGNTNNLGRGDEINLYDATGALVDRLTYGDQVYPGSPRAQNLSGNPVSLAALDRSDTAEGWVLAVVGDAWGSYASSAGDIGNPGRFALAVPEPGSVALLLAGLATIALTVRRRGA